MQSFKEYINEAYRGGFIKGWIHGDGKIVDTTDYDNYHIKQVLKQPNKFGLNKKKILGIFEDNGDDMTVPDSKQYAEDQYDAIEAGVVDNDVYLEEFLQKKGWAMFVIDKKVGKIHGYDEKLTKKAAKQLDDKYLPYETNSDLKLFEVKLVKGRPKYITNKFDWNAFVEGKKAGGNRSKIGDTMAQFRESISKKINKKA